MTSETVAKDVVRTSGSQFYDYPTLTYANKYSTDRKFGTFFQYGFSKKAKVKPRATNTNSTILSALSLLAFLFFLHVMQNSIQTSVQNSNAVMMFGSSATQQSKDEPEPKTEKHKVKRSLNFGGDTQQKETENEKNTGRQTRTLLEVVQKETNRKKKFIENVSNLENWKNELTQISDEDIEDQKLKTFNLTLYWQNHKLNKEEPETTNQLQESNEKENVTSTPPKVKPTKLRRLKKREKASMTPKPILNIYPKNDVLSPTMEKLLWNQKHVVPHYRVASKTHSTVEETNREVTPESQVFDETTQISRTSEYVGTIPPVEHSGPIRPIDEMPPESPTPAVGLNLNTYQTFPVYHNHRVNPLLYKINHTLEAMTFESFPHTENHVLTNKIDAVTTEPTTSNPIKMMPYEVSKHNPNNKYLQQPIGNKIHKLKYPNNQYRHSYPSRYRYVPYRKIVPYDTSNASYRPDRKHDGYHQVVIAKYPNDDSEFDLWKFLWAFMTSLAKPLTKLVPNFAKESGDEPRCYDLLVCEFQRLSRLVGPTAETLVSSAGALLTLTSTEDTRQIIMDAIDSGRENTCQDQIKNCENTSGGKSALTVIAQILEVKAT